MVKIGAQKKSPFRLLRLNLSCAELMDGATLASDPRGWNDS